jgi:hypothetical protein
MKTFRPYGTALQVSAWHRLHAQSAAACRAESGSRYISHPTSPAAPDKRGGRDRRTESED